MKEDKLNVCVFFFSDCSELKPIWIQRGKEIKYEVMFLLLSLFMINGLGKKTPTKQQQKRSPETATLWYVENYMKTKQKEKLCSIFQNLMSYSDAWTAEIFHHS